MVYITPTITAIDSPYLSEKNTGLGNVLFQIASVYGLANTYGHKNTFPYVKLYCDKLKRLYNFDHYKTILRNLYNEKKEEIQYTYIHDNQRLNRTYDEKLRSLLQKPSQNIAIKGYMEVLSYFKEFRNQIQELFGIDATSETYIQEKYGDILRGEKTCISIHFRCGKDIPHNYNYSDDYYTKAIEYFKNIYKNTHFFIFSDNTENIPLEKYGLTENYTMVEGNPDYIDLWLMSKCDHYIITTSTFCWWGVYLNKKENPHVLHEINHSHTYIPLDYSFTKNYIGI
jgi:hypothetical protein